MKKILGIEFGSTRIKAVLIDECGKVLATGDHQWENELKDGYWSYPMDEVIGGLQASVRRLKENSGERLGDLSAIGISAMMHGYLPFTEDWYLLAPFRTWRNTTTAEASDILSKELSFHIPQRWSCCHFYQAILNGEAHVKDVCHLNTLSGYVHFLLTGNNVLGINDASGMFPTVGGEYDGEKMAIFDRLLAQKGIRRPARSLFPQPLVAGENAGFLTEAGAKLLDPTGDIPAGIPLCPPEGDMGTGLVATNVVKPGEASISLGTSANLCVVLDKPFSDHYEEVDIFSSVTGQQCAMLHTSTCTSEIDKWAGVFREVLELFGVHPSGGELYTALFNVARNSDEDTGKIAVYNFLAGEPLARTATGAPMTVRENDSTLTLPNFMQAQIYAAISTVRLGTDILKKEDVTITRTVGHGGFFKTPQVGQLATSAMLGSPVTVMDHAGEGGAWGIALLAAFMLTADESFEAYLARVFAGSESTTLSASAEDTVKYNTFFERYQKYLPSVKLASES